MDLEFDRRCAFSGERPRFSQVEVRLGQQTCRKGFSLQVYVGLETTRTQAERLLETEANVRGWERRGERCNAGVVELVNGLLGWV